MQRADVTAAARELTCSRCGMERAEWLVTGSEQSGAPPGVSCSIATHAEPNAPGALLWLSRWRWSYLMYRA